MYNFGDPPGCSVCRQSHCIHWGRRKSVSLHTRILPDQRSICICKM